MANMARNKNEWANKVLMLVRSGNTDAAVAQIKVAPTVGDVTRLQALLEQRPRPPCASCSSLWKKSAPCWPRRACTAHPEQTGLARPGFSPASALDHVDGQAAA
jgi:hypothetical protein